jgi:hypothetical protein
VREKVDLATKFGVSFAGGKREIHGDPAYVRASCEGSLKRLSVDCIDLYYQHRIDTRVPIEVTVSIIIGFLIFLCFWIDSSICCGSGYGYTYNDTSGLVP